MDNNEKPQDQEVSTTEESVSEKEHKDIPVVSLDNPVSTKDKKKKLIALALVLALVIALGSWFAYKSMHKEETPPPEPTSVAPERSWNTDKKSQEFIPDAKVIDGTGKMMMSMPDNEQNGKVVSFPIIGIDSSGNSQGATLAPPERIDQIGHYVRSPEAGQKDAVGSAIYTSHVNYAGKVGVGSIWTSLKKGDPLTFTDDKGKQIHYIVDDNPFRIPKTDPEYVKKTSQTINDMKSREGKVVLVSCGGDFVGGSLGYNDNVFVVAHPVPEKPKQ